MLTRVVSEPRAGGSVKVRRPDGAANVRISGPMCSRRSRAQYGKVCVPSTWSS
ncbi:hypothetical protein GWI34_15305 [Actinomadura sp. DSM 109109]|nr:hypothetical protein [Actinomadura lepetitiana]